MTNLNSGYVGSSRSVRSERAIENYELPVALINKSEIENYLNSEDFKIEFSDITEEQIKLLDKTPATQWKYVTKLITSSSYHHTSSFFNMTDHYSLSNVAIKIIELGDDLKPQYQQFLADKKAEKADENESFKYGYIATEDWGGTRSHPKRLDDQINYGIIIGSWLYYNSGFSVKKLNINANKTVTSESFDSYSDLVKKHSELKGKSKEFNEIKKTVVKGK